MIYDPANPQKRVIIGGKAQGLLTLQAMGLKVPNFIVLPCAYFDPLIAHLPLSADGLRSREQALLQAELSPSIKASIDAYLERWNFPTRKVAVRSSIADEDGNQDAFPGMMDTFLAISEKTMLWESICKCAASAYNERSIAYRKQKGLSLAAQPAVIIQQFIEAEASGVVFSTFPEYPQETAIHTVEGIGEGLVNGTLVPDEFYFLKKTGILHRQQLCQENNYLSSDVLQTLFTTATEIEKLRNQPMDMEFAYAHNTLYWLQARPITQAIPEIIVYDNSNIQESYCGVTTPLTYSFAQRAYATVYRQTMTTLGLSKRKIQEQDEVVENLLGLVKGRIYYNINNWYRGLQLLPSFKQNKADMERMMGLDEPVDFVEDRYKSIGERLALLPSLILNLSRLAIAFLKLPQSIAAFRTHINQYNHRFYQQPIDTLSATGLLVLKEELDSQLLHQWTVPIVNDFRVMMANGKMLRRLKKLGLVDGDELLSALLTVGPELASIQPTLAMMNLAREAHTHPEINQLIVEFPASSYEDIALQFPAFHAKVLDYISTYGDRTVGELKLETVTMRVNPSLFYSYLRNYLINPEVLDTHQQSTKLHTEALYTLNELLKSKPYLRKSTFKQLAALTQAIHQREALRLDRTRLFGMYRSIYLAIGTKLVDEQVFSYQRAIFYLNEQEITHIILHPGSITCKELVEERRLQFERYQQEDVPSRVIHPSPPSPHSLSESQLRPSFLQGTGCYAGELSGEVIVITSPEDNLDVSGKIVCALRTDPGWAALFPTCKAVLIEKGSALSHSVILLRELQKPTIINIPHLTKRLQSGQRIQLNGQSGEIYILTS